MSEATADTFIILSSELIAQVMQEHFNKRMFKQRVEIVDLKPTETGYMFGLAFSNDDKVSTVTKVDTTVNVGINGHGKGVVRNNKGRFAKLTVGTSEEV